jgi:hypothetical protein
MPWPWVSRERFDDLQKRFDKVEAERDRLLEIVIDLPTAKRSVSVEEDKAKEEPMAAYTTPMDKILLKFDRAYSNKTKPSQFKAKVR